MKDDVTLCKTWSLIDWAHSQNDPCCHKAMAWSLIFWGPLWYKKYVPNWSQPQSLQYSFFTATFIFCVIILKLNIEHMSQSALLYWNCKMIIHHTQSKIKANHSRCRGLQLQLKSFPWLCTTVTTLSDFFHSKLKDLIKFVTTFICVSNFHVE